MARISVQAHQRLQDLAVRRGESHQQVLEDALELLDRRQFFAEAHEQYAALRANPAHAAELDGERAVIDGAVSDDLDNNE